MTRGKKRKTRHGSRPKKIKEILPWWEEFRYQCEAYNCDKTLSEQQADSNDYLCMVHKRRALAEPHLWKST